jgi:hypothetical protein
MQRDRRRTAPQTHGTHSPARRTNEGGLSWPCSLGSVELFLSVSLFFVFWHFAFMLSVVFALPAIKSTLVSRSVLCLIFPAACPSTAFESDFLIRLERAETFFRESTQNKATHEEDLRREIFIVEMKKTNTTNLQ